MPTKKDILRKRRHSKIRSKAANAEKRPRLVVFRSLRSTYAQLIDDENGKVLAASSDLKSKEKENKTEKAKKVGLDIAKQALKKKIKKVIFDRNGYKYHGRTKAVAEGAREGGLQF